MDHSRLGLGAPRLSAASPSTSSAAAQRPAGSGSIAKKYSIFTAALLGWVSFIFFGYDLSRGSVNLGKLGFLVAAAPLAAIAVAKVTNKILARPLWQLQRGIMAVREGRLDPIAVSHTGDEVEYLGESLNAMIAALKESKEEVRQYQETLRDKIQQRTEALEEATESALTASRTKSEFLANMSHELRTPMNGVLGMIDILIDENPTPAQREHLETAKSCANTLLALLNDILDLSKIEAGRMLLESVSFPVGEIIEDCVKSMIPQCRQKGIELRTRIEPGVAPNVYGDPLRVRQILTNLLSNAVKFTAYGWVEVRLGVEPGEADRDGRLPFYIEVADTGSGIPKEKHDAIFDEFTQADGSITRKYGGTGLGLAITRRLVELHKGQITLESELGKGSTFHARLMMQPSEVALPLADELRENGLQERVWVESREKRPRILVAEDNLVNQKVVRTVLEKRGYEVFIANNGLEAVNMLERDSFDAVLMDVQMPGLDGIGATKRIRADARWQTLPIIAMTAHAMTGDKERCLKAGMDGYLSKPVAAKHLTAAIDKFIREKSQPGKPEIKEWALPQTTAPQVPASEPIDANRAAKMLDYRHDLQTGMTMLFLQVAPEHLQRLHSASVRRDSATLRSHAQRLERAAERIAATRIAARAHEIAAVSASQDFSLVQDLLMALESDIHELESHVASAEVATA